jgi:hypothetical protein
MMGGIGLARMIQWLAWSRTSGPTQKRLYELGREYRAILDRITNGEKP